MYIEEMTNRSSVPVLIINSPSVSKKMPQSTVITVPGFVYYYNKDCLPF